MSFARYKKDRRLGVNTWGLDKSPVNKRAYPPGQHGPKGIKRVSPYGVQFKQQQILKNYYALKDGVFLRTFSRAKASKGSTENNFLALLESRLDAVVLRASWGRTIHDVRQLISHKHVKVNGKIVNIGSYLLKPGDEVSLVESSREKPRIQDALKVRSSLCPDYLKPSEDKFSLTLTRVPDGVTYPFPSDVQKVVELLSRRA